MARYPSIEVGDLWTADLADSMLIDFIVKGTNQSIASSTTFQDDDDLVTETLAVGTWSVKLELVMSAPTAVKVEWSNTGTMSGNRRCVGPGSLETTAEDESTSKWPVSGFGTDVVYGYRAALAQYIIKETSIVTVTVAGIITIRWGQNVSNASNTTCHASSHLEVKQVA